MVSGVLVWEIDDVEAWGLGGSFGVDRLARIMHWC